MIDNFFDHQVRRYHQQTDKLYYDNDTEFRGYRQGSNTEGGEKITMTSEDERLQAKKAKAERINSGGLLEEVGQAGEDSSRGDGRSLGVGGSY